MVLAYEFSYFVGNLENPYVNIWTADNPKQYKSNINLQ